MTPNDVERNNGSPSQDKQGNSEAAAPGGRRNRFRYRATTRTVEFEADFTDETAATIGQLMTGLVRPGITGQPVATSEVNPVVDTSARLAAPPNNGTSEADVTDPGETEPRVVGSHNGQLPQVLQSIFTVRDDRLLFDTTALKAKSRRDYVKRAVYLYLLGSEALGRPSVPRGEITEVLKERRVYDSNASGFLSTDPKLRRDEDSIELTGESRAEAEQYAKDVSDSSLSDKWRPGKQNSQKSTAKQSGASQEDAGGTQSAPKKSKGAGEGRQPHGQVMASWLSSLKDSELKAKDIHKALQDAVLADKGLIALWSLHKIANVKDTVAAGRLVTFLEDGFDVQVHRGNLERALGNLKKKESHLLISGGGTKYKITHSGVEHVEKMLQEHGAL